jgi:hypothetical protein
VELIVPLNFGGARKVVPGNMFATGLWWLVLFGAVLFAGTAWVDSTDPPAPE